MPYHHVETSRPDVVGLGFLVVVFGVVAVGSVDRPWVLVVTAIAALIGLAGQGIVRTAVADGVVRVGYRWWGRSTVPVAEIVAVERRRLSYGDVLQEWLDDDSSGINAGRREVVELHHRRGTTGRTRVVRIGTENADAFAAAIEAARQASGDR